MRTSKRERADMFFGNLNQLTFCVFFTSIFILIGNSVQEKTHHKVIAPAIAFPCFGIFLLIGELFFLNPSATAKKIGIGLGALTLAAMGTTIGLLILDSKSEVSIPTRWLIFAAAGLVSAAVGATKAATYFYCRLKETENPPLLAQPRV